MEVVSEGRQPQTSIGGSYAYAWQQMWKHFLYFFIVGLLVAILDSPSSVFRDSEIDHTAVAVVLQVLAAAYMFLINPVFNYGGNLLYLRGIRNEKMDVVVLFEGFKKNYLNIIIANLLTFAIIGIGLVLLIVPGIIFACRLAFVSFLVMDKHLDPMAAVEKSWEMTKGHGWTIFGMALLAIPIFIAGFLCLIVGAFISVMWISAAFAALYHAVDREEQQAYFGGQ